MLRKLGKKITNNFGLKILAALFAAVLWIVVVNIDNPIKTLTYTTSVTLENTNYITSLDKYFEVLDGNNTVSFSVSAQVTVQEKMSNSDFTAVADMEKIEYDEKSGSYRVPVKISTSKFDSKEVTISSKQHYMEVALEDLGRTQKPITAATKGTVADGCALGNVKIVTSNLLKISGPSSIVSQIDTAVATINVEGMATDVTDSVVPVLYDADGNVIDTTKLTLSINTATIMAQILNTKDVSLEFQTSGKVADGYKMTGIQYKPDTVRIKGEAATLNPVNKIVIPEEVLDLTGATENIETTVDISSYLPSGTSLVLNTDAKINVVVQIEPIVTKTMEVPVTNIKVENLHDGYEAGFGVDTVTVEVSGVKSAMDSLSEKNITGTIDAGGVGKGNHDLPIKFAMDEDIYQATAVVKVPVLITAVSNDNVDEGTDEKQGEGDSHTSAIPLE